MSLSNLTIKTAFEKLNSGKVSSEDLTKFYLERIEKLNSELNACLTISKDEALEAAKLADQKRKEGDKGRLLGVPCLIKDNIFTQAIRTTAASRMLKNYIAPYDATVVARLKKEGAVILGKTNLDEFAHGASTENSAFGPTHNPWDLNKVPGGSSGGSAAAVAADLCVFAMGTDTGGSIRQPSSFCSTFGLKPTYGRASRYGLVAMTSSTDVPGPITKTAEDAAIILDIIQGRDNHDTTVVESSEVKINEDFDVKNLKIGLPKEYFAEGMDSSTRKIIQDAIDKFVKMGAKIIEISLPHTKYCVPVYYIVTPSEVSSNLARFDGVRYGHKASNFSDLEELYLNSRGEGFGKEAKRRIMIGTYVLSAGYFDAYYTRAQKVRTRIIEDFQREFTGIDCILTPVSPHTAFDLGSQVTDPLKMYLEDIYVTGASLAGLPAVSVPCGFAEGLPVGMQLIGNYLEDNKILNIAHFYQKNTEWHLKHPEL